MPGEEFEELLIPNTEWQLWALSRSYQDVPESQLSR
jgi:hypothetical protein